MDQFTHSDELSLASAVQWLADLLTGRIGTAVAVIAIAWLGINMLQGRLALRDGTRVLIGCFILFGAPVITQGLLQSTEGHRVQRASSFSPVDITPSPAGPANVSPFDPYVRALPH